MAFLASRSRARDSELVERIGVSVPRRARILTGPARAPAHAQRMRKATMCAPFGQTIERCSSSKGRIVTGLGATPTAADPLRLRQRVELFVVKPNSGLFSTLASARSSSGSSSASPAPTDPSPRCVRSAPAGRRRRPRSALLERADDRLEQRSTLAHQHQHVARPRARRAPSTFTVRAIFARELDGGLVSLAVSNGASHLPCSALSRRGRSAPTFRPARALHRARSMHGPHGGSAVSPLKYGRRSNTGSTAPSTAAPERTSGRAFFVANAVGRVERAREQTAHLSESPRHRALEREDRLLFVADGKQGAPYIGRDPPGRNSATMVSTISHCLGLVSCASSIEHVVDAEIELVEHPGRRRVGETAAPASCRSDRRSRAARGAPFRRDSARSLRGDGDQRAGAFAGLSANSRASRGADAILLGDEPGVAVRIGPGGKFAVRTFFRRSQGSMVQNSCRVVLDAFVPGGGASGLLKSWQGLGRSACRCWRKNAQRGPLGLRKRLTQKSIHFQWLEYCHQAASRGGSIRRLQNQPRRRARSTRGFRSRLPIVSAITFKEVIAETIGKRDLITAWTGRAGGVQPAIDELTRTFGLAPGDSIQAIENEYFSASAFPQAEWPALMEILASSDKPTDRDLASFLRCARAATGRESIEHYLRLFYTRTLRTAEKCPHGKFRQGQSGLEQPAHRRTGARLRTCWRANSPCEPATAARR